MDVNKNKRSLFQESFVIVQRASRDRTEKYHYKCVISVFSWKKDHDFEFKYVDMYKIVETGKKRSEEK